MHMSPTPTDAPITLAAVVVAAGKGLRAGQPLPKQFAMWRGKPVLRHAVEKLLSCGVELVCVVIPNNSENVVLDVLSGLDSFILVTGGDTRQVSVANGLGQLSAFDPEIVLIHDAARPDCPPEVIARLVGACSVNTGAIPVLPVVDSMVVVDGNVMADKADRDALRRVQTPQSFRFTEILAAHHAWNGPKDAGDDAQVARAAGMDVALIEGDERLQKLTFAGDFVQETRMVRTGTGFDVHRLAAGEELWLCGIKLDHDKGLAGHSDADVALHAVVDALLGACGEGDIGQHFPPSDPQWRGAPSSRFVEHAVSLAAAKGYAIGNVDLAIICEAPKIGPHREAMRDRLAQLLGVQPDCVNVKATTTERLGFAGRGEGIAAQAVATLVSN